MTLPFSTHLNGKPTYFVEKVLKTFDDRELTESDKEMLTEAIENHYLDVFKYDEVKPKIHTIRRDEKNRWKPGTKIDFFINCRQKNMFRFAPVLPVMSIQKIEIVYYTDREVLREDLPPKKAVAIDDRRLKEEEIELLAKNDGFDSVEEFFKYFNDDFEGKIIHWTDFKY